MAQPWKTIDSIATDEGALELRQRGERDFIITIGPQVLMNSMANRSEVVLGPLAALTENAVSDPRVTVEICDVARRIRRSAVDGGDSRFDAIVLDLYRGPHAKTHHIDDPLYGSRAIDNMRAALKPCGAVAVWGENYDEGFDKRLRSAGCTVATDRPGRGGLRHAVFLAHLKQSKKTGMHAS